MHERRENGGFVSKPDSECTQCCWHPEDPMLLAQHAAQPQGWSTGSSYGEHRATWEWERGVERGSQSPEQERKG